MKGWGVGGGWSADSSDSYLCRVVSTLFFSCVTGVDAITKAINRAMDLVEKRDDMNLVVICRARSSWEYPRVTYIVPGDITRGRYVAGGVS